MPATISDTPRGSDDDWPPAPFNDTAGHCLQSPSTGISPSHFVTRKVRFFNGTLHYHFPSKDALILGVVDYLIEDLKNNRAVSKCAEQTALDELHMEFEDIRLRLRRTPEEFIVLSDLAVRSWRDPAVAKMFRKLDDGWHVHLVALLKRGIRQGIFRKDLNVPLCARAIMVALRGIGYQSRLPHRKVDELLSELATQTEHWITAKNAPQ